MTRQLYSQPVLRSPLISQACDYDMDGAYHSRHLSSASSVDSGWLAYLRFAASAAQTVCLKAAPRLLLNHYLGHLGEARKRKHGTPPDPKSSPRLRCQRLLPRPCDVAYVHEETMPFLNTCPAGQSRVATLLCDLARLAGFRCPLPVLRPNTWAGHAGRGIQGLSR